ncbi:ABC transporter permease [Tamlana nanhaiensis]|uniref:ABC transporter permease n=1 Tax=Neotamlana nanhaiensis TaxID=1382798 RepID=A0A0D7VZJ0_9FLAO|nr:ABC transporter permease [Tamlana nanhaiensis]KJD32128.1 ABC transporter permease [Tamlana nanhaiensis]KJD32290.1 ABC transporter permease [Tamlana nanhaiensis]
MNLSEINISELLPHRPPFLMVDKVISIDDERVCTQFFINETSIFNDNGYFAEAGLIEYAAQTCSCIVGKSFYDNKSTVKLIGFISAIKKVTIQHLPKVNTTISSNANLISRFDADDYSLCNIECTIIQDHKELVSCNLNLIIREIN